VQNAKNELKINHLTLLKHRFPQDFSTTSVENSAPEGGNAKCKIQNAKLRKPFFNFAF
jgi:hypothetical protein